LSVGKRTLVGWVGCKRGFLLFGAAVLAAYTVVAACTFLGLLGGAALLGLCTAPLAWRAVAVLRERYHCKEDMLRSSRLAVATHALAGLALLADAGTWRGYW
jgi:1,4-dihydroxy-2-naphthoate octaprenyltransferase